VKLLSLTYNGKTGTLTRSVLKNIFIPASTDNYKEIISYDANGNTQTYLRNDETGAAKNNYNYAYTSGTNKLSSISNSVNSQTKTYNYDAIGNTTEDGMQGVTNAEWNVYGKLQSATNKDGVNISYTYSADGQRISKKVDNVEEWYVRDATGNVMATYKKDASINSGNLRVTEIYKYGSSLLSIKDARINVQNPTGGGRNNFVRGNDNYILTDANGNTKSTVSHKKMQHSIDGVTVSYYTAEVRTATLHSTYGANAKTFNGGFLSANFNGQRKSTEIGDDAQTALFWEYNGDVGRRWNVDPKPNKFLSVFACFEDNPIYKIDVLGDSGDIPNKPPYRKTQPGSSLAYDTKSKNYKLSLKKSVEKNKTKQQPLLSFSGSVTLGEPGTVALKIGVADIKVGIQQSVKEIDIVGVRENIFILGGKSKNGTSFSRGGIGLNYVGYGSELTIEKSKNNNSNSSSLRRDTKLSVPFYSITKSTFSNGKSENQSDIYLFDFKFGFILGVDFNIKINIDDPTMVIPERTLFNIAESTLCPPIYYIER